MSVKKFAVATYKDEEVLFDAIKKVRKEGVHIHNVYTPFPVHGLDHALSLRDTDLHVLGFIYGITGTTVALSFMSWVFTKDWRINFGGKPLFSLPAFIPITFELTVLFAAVGMVLSFCYLNQIMPGVKKHIFKDRQTDDTFVLTIEIQDENQVDNYLSLLKNTGAEEVETQIAEEGWWYGRYDQLEEYQKLPEYQKAL